MRYMSVNTFVFWNEIQIYIEHNSNIYIQDSMAEWLRRVIRNHMGYARVGSNPTAVVYQYIHTYIIVVL